MNPVKTYQTKTKSSKGRSFWTRAVLWNTTLLLPISAMAHHPLDGRQPDTMMEGLLSGIGHPVIGLDHLAFIVAVGLLAAVTRKGLLIPVAFVIGSLLGISAHLMMLNVPGNELLVAGSIICLGVVLTGKIPRAWRLGAITGAIAGVVAGTFHGYAYAEAVVGVGNSVLISYIVGLTAIQISIAFFSYKAAAYLMKARSKANKTVIDAPVRAAGFAVAGVGALFLSSGLIG